MKQLHFVFAALGGITLVAGAADAATRYAGSSTRYVEPTPRHNVYEDYRGCDFTGCYPEPETAPVIIRPQKVEPAPAPAPAPKKSEPRKPNTLTLSDPFFQPRSGHVGSLTDIGLAWNSYDFEIVPATGPWGGLTGNWKASEFFIKEDLSVGITDEVAVLGMIKYSNTKYQMHWNSYAPLLLPASTDKMSDSGISIWGLGLQWKFYEDDEWVANVGGFFQSAEIANNLMLAGKVGYKVTPETMVYGLANLAYIMWDDSSYGNGIIDNAGQVAYIAFERDVTNSIYVEGGAGVFHKFTDQWSADLQGIFGSYSWHSQLSARAAIYWQPMDSLALGLYGKTSLWDSANSAKDVYMYAWCEPGTQCAVDNAAPPTWWAGLPADWSPLEAHCMGRAALSKYRDTQVGINLLLYF
ncbi:MAG: hypothetical protein FWF97_00640 [Alphaproteobacteria bacterium]|nr:hypothetical protein [Alphaproteobacteria bacterium]